MGRRGPGGPNLARENGNKGKGKSLNIEKITNQKKMFARKKRRRGVCIATHNVRTMAVHGNHGIGRVWEVLSTFGNLGCDVIGIQETRRSGQSVFEEAGYTLYCSSESCGESQGKGKAEFD